MNRVLVSVICISFLILVFVMSLSWLASVASRVPGAIVSCSPLPIPVDLSWLVNDVMRFIFSCVLDLVVAFIISLVVLVIEDVLNR